MSLCDPFTFGSSFDSTSHALSSAILLLPILGSSKLRPSASLLCRNLHTKFYPDSSTGSLVLCGQTDRRIHVTNLCAFISCTSCQESIMTAALRAFLPAEDCLANSAWWFPGHPQNNVGESPVMVDYSYCNCGNEGKHETVLTTTMGTNVAKVTMVT
jgi:hypothetical protein